MVPRRTLDVALSCFSDEPVVALHGARAVGKSTILGELAERLGTRVLDLDDLGVRAAAAADPATFVAGPGPICIDEYQHVPAILDAIKAELNRDLRPGRFLMTGSTRFGTLPLAARSLTGRLHVVSLWPLSQGEIDGVHEDLLEALLSDPDSVVSGTSSTTTRSQYVSRVVAGGFPLALARGTESSRHRWFGDYERLLLERDVRDLARVRQRENLRSLLHRLAGQTGQVLNLTSAARDTGMDRSTASDYVRLLEGVFLLHRLPAWGKTLRSRATGTPKIHVVDSGMAAWMLRLSQDKLERPDPTTWTEFGHLFETFVVGELIKQSTWIDGIIGLGHWRTHDGDEVDLVIEREDGEIVAFEVKSGALVRTEDIRGLRKLRSAVGGPFVAGIVFYTGERSYVADDRIMVLPVDRLWTSI